MPDPVNLRVIERGPVINAAVLETLTQAMELVTDGGAVDIALALTFSDGTVTTAWSVNEGGTERILGGLARLMYELNENLDHE